MACIKLIFKDSDGTMIDKTKRDYQEQPVNGMLYFRILPACMIMSVSRYRAFFTDLPACGMQGPQ